MVEARCCLREEFEASERPAATIAIVSTDEGWAACRPKRLESVRGAAQHGGPRGKLDGPKENVEMKDSNAANTSKEKNGSQRKRPSGRGNGKGDDKSSGGHRVSGKRERPSQQGPSQQGAKPDATRHGQDNQIRLNVLDGQFTLHTTCEIGWASALVAALSLEPETLEEWELALARYFEPAPQDLFADWQPGLCEEPWGSGLIILDLSARLLVHQTPSAEWLREGSYPFHVHDEAIDCWLNFEVPTDWLYVPRDDGWRGLSERRRSERSARPTFDTRDVIYGQLCEFLAEGCLAAKDTSLETIRALHGRWLLTPRADLRGKAPRDVLLADRQMIDEDVHCMAHAWSRLGRTPRGLARQVTTYRHGGYGTHENVLYYELVRTLIYDGLEQIHGGRSGDREIGWEPDTGRGPDVRRDAGVGGDKGVARDAGVSCDKGVSCDAGAEIGSAQLTARLERVRQDVLGAPQSELSGHTPAQVIDTERRRLPMLETADTCSHGGGGEENCPICDMLGEGFSPAFWFLDGCNMDSEFAFSLHALQEDWEDEQRMYVDWERASEAGDSETGDSETGDSETGAVETGDDDDDEMTLDMTPADPPPAEDSCPPVSANSPALADFSALRASLRAEIREQPTIEDSPWRSCFFNPGFLDTASPGIAVQVLLFDIGAKLGELQQDLREDDRQQRFAASLLEHFAKMRTAIGEQSNWQVDSVRQHFSNTLRNLVADRRDLKDKRNDLEQQLDRLLSSVAELLANRSADPKTEPPRPR